MIFHHRVMHPKGADRNSLDPEQTALSPWSGSTLFAQTCLSDTSDHFSVIKAEKLQMSHLMRLWHFSSSINHSSNAHPVGLDVWLFGRTGPIVSFYTSCVRIAKALARLRGCAGSPEPSLVAYVISTIISWAGSLIKWTSVRDGCLQCGLIPFVLMPGESQGWEDKQKVATTISGLPRPWRDGVCFREGWPLWTTEES